MIDNNQLLRFTTAGSVDDGKSTLIGRLLYDSKSIFEDQLEAVEKTSPILAMFDPITFEIAMSLELFKAELILIRSSGAEVAKDTTVKPITTLEILYFNESSTDDFKR